MRILLCQCKSARLIDRTIYDKVSASVCSRFQSVCVDDLCAMAARRDPRLAGWAREPLIVLACYERAVQSLFSHAGAPLPESAVVLNLRGALSSDKIIEKLPLSDVMNASTESVQADAEGWPAWFPVIDYVRCRNCKQCLNFCLFGVYEQTDDKKVRVTCPQSCKNGCPACARVCPDAAIVFPKYDKSPINGDAVDDVAWRQTQAESAKSLKHRLSGNVYQLLRQRQADSAPRTVEELKTLKEQLDIPDHLFNSGSAGVKTDS